MSYQMVMLVTYCYSFHSLGLQMGLHLGREGTHSFNVPTDSFYYFKRSIFYLSHTHVTCGEKLCKDIKVQVKPDLLLGWTTRLQGYVTAGNSVNVHQV